MPEHPTIFERQGPRLQTPKHQPLAMLKLFHGQESSLERKKKPSPKPVKSKTGGRSAFIVCCTCNINVL